ncbi:hypothetical protein HO173_003549 [Letharia columbiana]|uniref:Putative gamma-glutamylcyclotransferase n=1 Tax=Letharia columbiana TaxID=112416 RepID=A0A8H6G0M4_9LECA|nr:uncharacterized protein HO173_003549 [Letharia columbiana]KAF6238269.1 hypothetical protein HO173_003549 [Letharia columbiana]
MAPNLLSGEEVYGQPIHRQYSTDTFPRPYFFYGSLMDPQRLSEILRSDIKHLPSLRSAHTIGYRCKLWGPYPALVYAPDAVTHGMVLEMQDEKQVERLQHYETSNYRVQACTLRFEDGSEARGETFMWDGEEGELREGSFDLKAWQSLEYGGHAVHGDITGAWQAEVPT